MRTRFAAVCGLVLAVVAALPNASTASHESAGPRVRLVAFWDRENGLAAAGDQFGAGRGAVLVTHDGGETFSPVLLADTPVVSLRVDGEANAVVGLNADSDGGSTGAETTRYLRSTDGGLSWHRLSDRPRAPSFYGPDLELAVTGEAEFDWLDSLRSNIIRSADGGETWTRVHDPCPDYWFVGTELVDDRHAWAFCAQEGAVGTQAKAIYVSHHAGRHWRLRARVELPGHPSRGHLPYIGYPSGMDFSARGMGLLWGDYTYVTTNGGAKWRPLGLRYNGINVSSGTVVGRLTGFVVRNRSLLRTTDGGTTFGRVSRFEPLGYLFSQP